jgi:hypothetical protein
MYRGKDTGSGPRSTSSQPRSERLLCCASRPSCPCSSWFVARACQHWTTISVAITHTHIHTTERDTHTQWTVLSFLPLFSRPRASTACPARLCHTTPLSLSVYVCGVLICLFCIGCSPHLPHCPCCRTLNVLNQTFNQAPSPPFNPTSPR